MDLDLENLISESAADVFEFAMREASSISEVRQLIPQAIRDVRKQYPDLSMTVIHFALGRAIGRIEGRRAERQGRGQT